VGLQTKARRGSRIDRLRHWMTAVTFTAGLPTYNIVGDGTSGETLLAPARLLGLQVFGAMAALDADTLVTITVYKNSVAGGNKVFEVVIDMNQAADTIISVADLTVNNAGTELLEENDTTHDCLLVQAVASSAGTIGGQFKSLCVEVLFETAA
jgi:mannose/fructose/N-acetylgalactosamine-specific phosphotransferase system component IID